MDKSENFYETAHDFVAAIRVLTRTKSTPPSVEDICLLLGQSTEWGGLIARKLVKLGIVKEIAAAYGARFSVGDHLRLEEISREEEKSGLGREIENFKKSQGDVDKKVKAIQAELARKKQDLFADLEKKLKESLE